MNIPNLEFIGMLSLGAFVGGIINYGLNTVDDEKSYAKVISASFGAAFGGSLIVFLNDSFQLDHKESIYLYPVGLVVSLLWGQVEKTIKIRISSSDIDKRVIGYIHLVAVSILTIYLVVILLFGSTS